MLEGEGPTTTTPLLATSCPRELLLLGSSSSLLKSMTIAYRLACCLALHALAGLAVLMVLPPRLAMVAVVVLGRGGA